MSSIDKIIDNLYLGDISVAKKLSTLQYRGITHILQAMNGMTPAYPEKFIYKVINV